jgi:hypothetical protein
MADSFLVAPKRIKRAGAVRRYTVVLTRELRSYWIGGRRYSLNDYVRSPSISGFAYQCTVAGEAGTVEPAWPRVLGGTVADGSITWTAVAPATNAVDTIASVAWSQVSPPDSALTIPAQSNTIEEATAQFSGGTSGSTYRIRCLATTTAGDVYDTQFDLEIA